MDKTVRVGKGECGHVYAKIKIAEGKLTISGVEGPLKSGNARGGCGQIKLEGITDYAPGWDHSLLTRFQEVWSRWHLNDMRAGCEHQRAKKWNEIPIDKSKPTNSYGKHFPGQKYSSWNMVAWVTREEHPMGLLSFPCPKCGYKYGSAWLYEELPQEVVEFLGSLPETDRTPAWV